MRKIALAIISTIIMISCSSNSNNSDQVPQASSDQIVRVEPLSWWVGMKTPLQLIIAGPNISDYNMEISGGQGVTIEKLHKADSPNYLFADVKIASTAKAGTYWIVFKKDSESFKYPYILENRQQGSAERKSFTTADLIYLINPDRFSDGDPSIDSVATMKEGLDRKNPGGRHGGDLQGIMDHLDYIADLGATAIWPTPLLEDNDSTYSYHGYACSDYYHLDPRYGTNEQYKEFVSLAHSKGLKVIMDVVTNHCSLEHWWMKDMPFKDWIHVNDPYFTTNHNFSTLLDPNASDYDKKIMTYGWFVESMPDINLANPFVLKYFQQWAIWWVEYSGLDGFRVDTFPYNDKIASSQWCEAVLSEYPNLNIMGECWIHYPDQLAYWQGGRNNPDGFNTYLPTIMDFPLNDAFNSSLAVDKTEKSVKSGDIYDVYASLSHDFEYHDLSKMLIFFSNHDCPRMGDVVGGNPDKMKLAYTLLATLRGIPQLYYGDEMMFMTGSAQRDDGKLRMDFPGGWKDDPVNLFTPEGRSLDSQAEDLYNYASTLFNWRKTADAIHNGKTLHFVPKNNTYAYFRYLGAKEKPEKAVFVFINNSDTECSIPWDDYREIASGLSISRPLPVEDSSAQQSGVAVGRNVITGENIEISDDYTVPANTALVVEFE